MALSGSGDARKVNVCSEKKLSTQHFLNIEEVDITFNFLISYFPLPFFVCCVFGCQNSCSDTSKRLISLPINSDFLSILWQFCWRSFVRSSFVLQEEKELLLLPGCALLLGKGNGSAGSRCAQGIWRKVQAIPPAELSSFGGAQGCV